MAQVSLISYDPRFAADFARLNYQWIEQYFAIETEDRLALDNPEAYAIHTGGEIFFLLEDDAVVGTVAMVPFKGGDVVGQSQRISPQIYELAKMAVDPLFQGRGHSKLLMRACIDFAQSRGASEIVLITNDQLGPALGLYTQAGFVPMPQNSDTRYARGNLEMRLTLQAHTDS